MRSVVLELRDEWEMLEEQTDEVTQELAGAAREDENSRPLLTVPGIGPLTATALTAAVGNGMAFRKGRDLAAWLGLVTRQHSTGGNSRLLGISKRGNPYLRRLFVHGARSVLTGETKPASIRRMSGSPGSQITAQRGVSQQARAHSLGSAD
jgi:transposase